jgi:hypothetical protein
MAAMSRDASQKSIIGDERHYLLFAQKIRTLKQSLKPLLMAAILGKLLTKNRQ